MISLTIEDDVGLIGRIDAVPTILDVVCQTTGMGFAAVARVTEDRWIACGVRDDIAFGLEPGGELEVQTTLCNEIRQHRALVVIDNVADDPVYAAHHTPLRYGFKSYISVPITLPDGTFFGTLCAIDPQPAKLGNSRVTGMFTLFAQLIAFHIDANRRLEDSANTLERERIDSGLREQFIAVLGHDLRNPLSAISAGLRVLGREPKSGRTEQVLSMLESTAERMYGLIDDVLDFARGRLGGGIPLDREILDVQPALEQVIAELRANHPERRVETAFTLERPFSHDAARVAQLLSNVLGNALTHGSPHEPVRVEAVVDDSHFTLSVINTGPPIPQKAMEHLFSPFGRDKTSPAPKGLGLGLYIASEIARAHEGVLTAASDDAETRFTFMMPIG